MFSQVAEGDIWGYYASETPTDKYIMIGGGTDTRAAIVISGDETVMGAQISAIRIPVWSANDVELMEQGTVWIAEDLQSGEKYAIITLPCHSEQSEESS